MSPKVYLSKAVSLNSSSDETTSLWQMFQYNYLIEAYALVRVPLPQCGCIIEEWLHTTNSWGKCHCATTWRRLYMWFYSSEAVSLRYTTVWAPHWGICLTESTLLRYTSCWPPNRDIKLILSVSWMHPKPSLWKLLIGGYVVETKYGPVLWNLRCTLYLRLSIRESGFIKSSRK